MYCLVRLVQCAALNASRIRLVWGRLWAVVAPHLVSAACARCGWCWLVCWWMKHTRSKGVRSVDTLQELCVLTLQQEWSPCQCSRATSEPAVSARRDDDIALLAVEQLGSLAARLLSRTELSNSTQQVPVCPSSCSC